MAIPNSSPLPVIFVPLPAEAIHADARGFHRRDIGSSGGIIPNISMILPTLSLYIVTALGTAKWSDGEEGTAGGDTEARGQRDSEVGN